MKLLSPRLDVVFKKLFSEPDNKPLLTDFLASVLEVDSDKIHDLRIVNGEITPSMINEKFIRLDLTVLIDGAKIDIEMQCLGNEYYRDRALYYWAKLYARDLKSGEGYDMLEQTISINICNFNMFECEEYHSTFKLFEQNRHELLTDKCRLDFLELKKARNTKSRQIKRLERWMKFLNVETEEEADMIASIDPVMEKAVLALRVMSSDSTARQLAQMREEQMHEEATAMAAARSSGIKIGMEQGLQQGMEQGLQQGMEQGLQQGMEQGRSEVIKMMRLSGMSEEQINSILSQS